MKKKGLIVATIVMVLVLATSITTATYAWFTTSAVTSLQGFSVSVVASNAVNIGLKIDNTYSADPNAGMFISGDGCTYVPAAAGTIGGGNWTNGTPSLGPSIQHNINWGPQQSAVGITSADNVADATTANTGLWTNEGQLVVAANLNEAGSLSGQKAASANITAGETDAAGDYVYIFLGAQPTKRLTSNELVILIDGTTSTSAIVGILSAIHVAYRLNSSAAWTDVDVFGEIHYSQELSTVSTNLTLAQQTAYQATYNNTPAPQNRNYAFTIPGLSTTAEAIDQIEIVIYIAGDDSDCVTQAKGASGTIEIFFNAVEVAA